MNDYPVQGKLGIRKENYERDLPFIQERVGELSKGVLKSVPGYEFLQFWWVDFAATNEQWRALAPELDRRNILVTLYEAPTFYMEALAEEQKEKAQAKKPATARWLWLVLALAILVLIAILYLRPF